MKENSELQNNLATHLLMNQDCKGDYIVYKTKTVISDNNSDNHDISNFGDVNEALILLPVTRREIWTISEYRFLCSLEGVVTDRVHRLNMQRKEGLKELKDTNFTDI